MKPKDRAASINSWRRSIPSRLDREDPFLDDGYEARSSTRHTTREPDPPERPPPHGRPTTALSFLRAATPSLGRKLSAAFGRPATALGSARRGDDDDGDGAGKRRRVVSLLGGLLSRKRKRVSPSPPPMPPLRITLNFLFVGSQGCGQTSLLL